METNIILKYRRDNDCWVCPNCDSENGMSFGKCSVCGLERTPSVQILRAWSPEQERLEQLAAARPPATGPSYRTGYPMTEHPPVHPASAHSEISEMKYLWIVIVAVIIVVLLIIVAANA